MKLNQTQRHLLKDIAETPGKSGSFYTELGGYPYVSLSALWRKNLIEGTAAPAETSLKRTQFRLTDEGQQVLDEIIEEEQP